MQALSHPLIMHFDADVHFCAALHDHQAVKHDVHQDSHPAAVRGCQHRLRKEGAEPGKKYCKHAFVLRRVGVGGYQT